MQDKVSGTLSDLSGELKGTYYPLAGMTKEVQQQLIDDHFLFKEGDRFLQAANACRYWPTGRGIYHNDDKTFLVWVNEEDHLRIISMQMGGDLGTVYKRMVEGVNALEKVVPFSHSDRFGFLTFCPTNLGTTIRASVHIKLPKLAADKSRLDATAAKFNLQVWTLTTQLLSLSEIILVLPFVKKYYNNNLIYFCIQVRGTRGEHSDSEGGVYDISNKRRLGLTEYEAVKEMEQGILELIKIEKSL